MIPEWLQKATGGPRRKELRGQLADVEHLGGALRGRSCWFQHSKVLHFYSGFELSEKGKGGKGKGLSSHSEHSRPVPRPDANKKISRPNKHWKVHVNKPLTVNWCSSNNSPQLHNVLLLRRTGFYFHMECTCSAFSHQSDVFKLLVHRTATSISFHLLKTHNAFWHSGCQSGSNMKPTTSIHGHIRNSMLRK